MVVGSLVMPALVLVLGVVCTQFCSPFHLTPNKTKHVVSNSTRATHRHQQGTHRLCEQYNKQSVVFYAYAAALYLYRSVLYIEYEMSVRAIRAHRLFFLYI